MDKIDFNDKVVIITGAGSGLGKSYAIEFSKLGANVVVNDFGNFKKNSKKYFIADTVVSCIKKNKGSAIANYDDISTVYGGINLVKNALEYFGRIDILINNAGILRDKSFFKMSLDNWKEVIDSHLNGVYNVTSPTFKVMKKNGYGRIVMTTSAAGLYGNFGQCNYSAAKMAVIGMMNSLKLESVKCNINVNTIAPIAASNQTKGVFPEKIFNLANPFLVAGLVLYLSSEQCLESGSIYNVGFGYVNKVVISNSPWVKMFDKNSCCNSEILIGNLESIKLLNNGKEFRDAYQMFLDILSFYNQ